MTGRVRGVSTHHRARLNARWALCATSPDTIKTPDQLPAATAPEWLAIDAADTVAGSLRSAGRWSLDGPERRFDAEDWWFRAKFDAPARDAGERRLVFEGLAGPCHIWLNGAPLFASENMHIRHDCIEPLLIDGENELLLRFASLDEYLAQRRPRPRWRAPMVAHQQLRWARVSLLGRTPGWSPPAPAIGPWRAIEWHNRTTCAVPDLWLTSEVNGNLGRVTLRATLEPLDGDARIENVLLRVERNGVGFEAEALRPDEPGGPYTATLDVADPVLWWPHTHGDPALYDAELLIHIGGTSGPVRVDLGRLGFRTLTVDTSDGDFALSVNGVPIFCRGANWTPLDVVSPAASAEDTRAALAQVQAAGLNMLRVNGCMVYEDDAFFEACDAIGVLVWQDFMFANMEYPAGDDGFLATVREEARQQLARWQAHPSLAVICGNSEAEQQAAMWGSPREAWAQPLFDEHLAALAREFCPGVIYWPSSAHGGAFPHQNDEGTTSYYGVGAYLRPLEDARRANLRFASESLAFANVPPHATIARMPGGASLRTHHPGWKARVPRDLGAGWDFEDVRDHYLRLFYGVDPVALRSADHDRYLQLSRAVSAEVIEATMSEWRRPASACRGALVWFLRDFWAGAGWGLLDERGVPKAAFHGLRRAAAPIHLFLTDEGTNGLALHVVNDPGQPLFASVEVALYRDDGLRMEVSSREISVPAHGGKSWPIGAWFEGFIDISRAYRFGPTEHALVAAILRDAQGNILDRAYFFPEGQSAARQREVGLEVRAIEKHSDRGIAATIVTRTLAQSVYFDADGYVAQDEYFHLAPEEARIVHLIPSSDSAQPAARISVFALNSRSGATAEVPR